MRIWLRSYRPRIAGKSPPPIWLQLLLTELTVPVLAASDLPPGADAASQVLPRRRPRVLFINRSYWPDVEATGQLLTELCEDLADEFDVTVLCGQPRTVVEDVPAEANGFVEWHGVRIRRVRHTQFDKASFWGRLANMLTFQFAAAWSAIMAPRAEVVVVETDPPLLCLLGRLLQFVWRTRLVCYLQDIYPDIAVALGKLRPGVLTSLLRRMFFRIYRCSDAVIVLSRDMRDLLTEFGVSAKQIAVIPNWIDTREIYPIKQNNRFRYEHGWDAAGGDHKFVVMYSGNMGLSQRLDQVLDVAEQLKDCPEIVFALVGDGADRRQLERLAAEKRLTNVRFLDYQPRTRLAESLSAADLHLVILRPEITQLLMPSKLYGVLASGTPALVLADPTSELARIVSENNLGSVIDPRGVTKEVTAACAAAIGRYASARTTTADAGRRGREYAVRHCDRTASVGAMRKTLQRQCAVAGLISSP